MENQKIRTHVGEDGMLHINFPNSTKHMDVEVMIVYHTIREHIINPDDKTSEGLGYSANFIHNVLGSWEGEPLVRSEQPYYEHRTASEDREAS